MMAGKICRLAILAALFCLLADGAQSAAVQLAVSATSDQPSNAGVYATITVFLIILSMTQNSYKEKKI